MQKAEREPSKAEMAKFRRKLNRTIKHAAKNAKGKKGATGLGTSARKLIDRNLERNQLIQGLNHILDTGTPGERAGARKTKKRLSESWQNRNTGNLTGFWNPTEASK